MKTIKQMQIKRETRRRKSPSVLQMAFEQYSMFRKMQREKESSVLIIFNVINKHVIIMAFFAWKSTGCPWLYTGWQKVQNCDLIFVSVRQVSNRVISTSSVLQQISDEGIVKICRGCHRLQSLCVSGCCNLTDASLTALGLNCPRLKWVSHEHVVCMSCYYWPGLWVSLL